MIRITHARGGDGRVAAAGFDPVAAAEAPPDDLGFRFSNGSLGAGLQQAPPVVTGGVTVSRIELDPTQNSNPNILRIENEGVWNSIKNIAGPADGWNESLGTNIEVINFVDVRLDFANAPALPEDGPVLGLDLYIFGAKRGDVALGAGDDFAFVFFHSNGGTFRETFTIQGGDGNDNLEALLATDLPTWFDDPLADNPDPSNGRLWNPDYDGRFSRFEAFGGEGNDVITATRGITLIADGGPGTDALFGGDGDDILDNGEFYVGGGGNDTFVLRPRCAAQIEDFTDGDRILLVGFAPGVLLVEFGTGTDISQYGLSFEPEPVTFLGTFSARAGLVVGQDAFFV
jgi:hypothetical protein